MLLFSNILCRYVFLIAVGYPIITLGYIFQPDSLTQLDFYSTGMAAADDGDWESALRNWELGRLFLDKQQKSDPRLGVAYIELTTQEKLKQFYEQASELYLWGFSQGNTIIEYKNIIKKEVDRIMPLLNEAEQVEWEILLNSLDIKICQKIRLFWIQRDPIPSTVQNERLIEHWERIAYARENFDKNRLGVYDCDERGDIYVKYGKPDKESWGRFGSSAASDVDLMYHIHPSQRRNIRLWERSPEYEVWAYTDLATQEPSIFLFSLKDGIGNFRLVEGIESILPQPDFLRQKMYYAELASFSNHFRDRYLHIEDIWFMSNTSREVQIRLKELYYTHKREDKYNPTYKYALPEKSQILDSLGQIIISRTTLRFLDQNNRARLIIIISHSPQFRIENVQLMPDKTYNISSHKLTQTLVIRNRSLNEIYRKTEILSEDKDRAVIYNFDHDERQYLCTIGAEANSHDNKNLQLPDKSLLAVGNTFFYLDLPLNTYRDSLEISDLILGISAESSLNSAQYNFPVFPVEIISVNEYLHLYFEIYHLQLDDQGMANYTLDYGIRGFEESESQIRFSYTRNINNHKSIENFALNISQLRPGDYEFFMNIEDQLTGQIKSRSRTFTVVK